MGQSWSTRPDLAPVPKQTIVTANNEGSASQQEYNRVQAQTLILLQQIQKEGRDVHLVFTGPLCVRGDKLCRKICEEYTRNLFRYMNPRTQLHAITTATQRDPESTPAGGLLPMDGYTQILDHIDTQKTQSLQHHSVMMLYLCALLEELMTHLLDFDTASVGQRFCVYYQNPEDYAIAMARSAHAAKMISDSELKALEIQADLIWRIANRRRPAHSTIYIYLRYTDEHFLEEYKGAMEKASPEVRATMERIQGQALVSKRHLDALYTTRSNTIVNSYFSMVIEFEGRDLERALHGAVCTHRVLKAVRRLQELRYWQAKDEQRITYLTGTEWTVERLQRIPSTLCARKDQKEPSSSERAMPFSNGTPPLPHADRILPSPPPVTAVPVSQPVAHAPPPVYGSGQVSKTVVLTGRSG
jgi:hypothetical protein